MPSTDRKPFPKETEEFADDERISYSRQAETYVLEDPTTGEEFEWLATHRAWIPVTDEALIAQQASVFAIPGVDENEPAFDPRRPKRKAAGDEDAERPGSRDGKKAKRDTRPTAIYVTGIPLDATRDEIVSVFDRFGVITESLDTDEKRIYMYSDDGGKFKGDALISELLPHMQSPLMVVRVWDGRGRGLAANVWQSTSSRSR
nr:isoform 2 of hiv tat-specific factor 1 like [Quercus suber]